MEVKCSCCKKIMFPMMKTNGQAYKTCESCREKQRNRYAKTKQVAIVKDEVKHNVAIVKDEVKLDAVIVIQAFALFVIARKKIMVSLKNAMDINEKRLEKDKRNKKLTQEQIKNRSDKRNCGALYDMHINLHMAHDALGCGLTFRCVRSIFYQD